MDHSTTRQSLGVFWQGEEVDGFTLYSYWHGDSAPEPALDLRAWQNVESRAFRLAGEHWTVWAWDVRLHSWPAATHWRNLVLGTLDQLVTAGATVAWCGLEGAFADPPALFDPRRMSNGVWAARFDGQGVFEPPGLDEPFAKITDEQLVILRQAAGLVD